MVNTNIGLIIFFMAENGEALYSEGANRFKEFDLVDRVLEEL